MPQNVFNGEHYRFPSLNIIQTIETTRITRFICFFGGIVAEDIHTRLTHIGAKAHAKPNVPCEGTRTIFTKAFAT